MISLIPSRRAHQIPLLASRLRWILRVALGPLLAWPALLPAPAQGSDDECPGHFDGVDPDAGPAVAIPLVARPGSLSIDFDQHPWTAAAAVTGFFDISSDALAGLHTRVLVFYDTKSLWVGFDCQAADGPAPQARVSEADGPVWRDDSVEIYCDPDHSHRSFFQVAVNSQGIVYDARNLDKSWSYGGQCKTGRTPQGWRVAVRLPLNRMTRSRPRPGDIWAVNFCRSSVGAERSSWAPLPGRFQLPAFFGHIVFGEPGQPTLRLARVDPMHIGENVVLFDGPPPVCRISGRDRAGRPVPIDAPRRGDGGELHLRIDDDRARKVYLFAQDERGRPLSATRYPLESPEVAGRIRQLHEQAGQIRSALDLIPQGQIARMHGLLDAWEAPLARAMRTIEDPVRRTQAAWAELDGFADRAEPALNHAAMYARTRKVFGEADFAVGLASPMHKVLIQDPVFRERISTTAELAIARNEHEALQVVVIPFDRDLEDVRVEVSSLEREGGGAAGDVQARVSLVGHVDVNDNPPYKAASHGWWPDPLLDFQERCPARIGEQVAFWVDVASAADARPGRYRSSVTVSARDCAPVVMTLNVRVLDFALPAGTHLPTAFTFDRHAARKIHGDRWSGTIERAYHDLILDHRLGIDHLYRREPPDLETVKYSLDRGAKVFNICFAGHGGQKDDMLRMLADYVPRLRSAGLLEHAYLYGFDEATQERFDAIRDVFGEVHRRFPGLRTVTTAYDLSFGADTRLGEVVDVWVPLIDGYHAGEAARLRQAGGDMWWYICITPHHPYPNWFIEYPAIEARLLTGAMSFKYDVGGFLYYLINLWNGNHRPITSGPYTGWDPGSFTNNRGQTANGDGSLICPGPDGPLATIRLANIRDGLEDYEYLYLLRQTVDLVKRRSDSQERTEYVETAGRLLSVPAAVVQSMVSYTRDPGELDAFRLQVADAILAGRRLAGGD